eukprot:CAMPEP_0178385748 /NCGR_PEP_ID=MMETSP0689_2-20121128/8188_1 /TAXON_ID=160604 /ORGANISM="Amphidinium massartii, Strain CS-259" /LENGTH=124 /DNA_ID=CAMNT_0020006031 /DNA_START=77 /DNA_END=451 /DNA_ORIENTATION=+
MTGSSEESAFAATLLPQIDYVIEDKDVTKVDRDDPLHARRQELMADHSGKQGNAHLGPRATLRQPAQVVDHDRIPKDLKVLKLHFVKVLRRMFMHRRDRFLPVSNTIIVSHDKNSEPTSTMPQD